MVLPSTDDLLGKVPTRSIITTEAFVNALVSYVTAATDYKQEDFLHNHPGGSIGATRSRRRKNKSS